MLTTLGCPVNEETIPALIEYAAQFNLNVTDDLDNVELFYTLTGESPFAVMSIDEQYGLGATFTVIGSDGFHAAWEVQVTAKYGPFYQIKEI
jgi:hypothetical protein